MSPTPWGYSCAPRRQGWIQGQLQARWTLLLHQIWRASYNLDKGYFGAGFKIGTSVDFGETRIFPDKCMGHLDCQCRSKYVTEWMKTLHADLQWQAQEVYEQYSCLIPRLAKFIGVWGKNKRWSRSSAFKIWAALLIWAHNLRPHHGSPRYFYSCHVDGVSRIPGATLHGLAPSCFSVSVSMLSSYWISILDCPLKGWSRIPTRDPADLDLKDVKCRVSPNICWERKTLCLQLGMLTTGKRRGMAHLWDWDYKIVGLALWPKIRWRA